MKKYTLKRIITSLFTLLAILLVLFILMQLMPGSPFNDEKLTPEMRASLYAKYGLDQPIYVQFFRYVTNMLRGDFGVSYNISKNTPISQLIQSRLPISIRVGGMAVTLGAIVGLVLGIIAALKRDTIFDTLDTIISVIGVSVPSYVIALALSYTFGFKLKWFPMLFSAKDVFGSSVLPSISLSMFTMASIARKFIVTNIDDQKQADYIRNADDKTLVIVFSDSGEYVQRPQNTDSVRAHWAFENFRGKIVMITSNPDAEKNPLVDYCLLYRHCREVHTHRILYAVLTDLLAYRYHEYLRSRKLLKENRI